MPYCTQCGHHNHEGSNFCSQCGQRLTPEDVQSMSERSDPLGPPAEIFPVKEYELVTPDVDEIVDTVRIELLSLKPCGDRPHEVTGITRIYAR